MKTSTTAPRPLTLAVVLRALGQFFTLAAIYGTQRTAAARAWLRASHEFFGQDGDPITCTGWQFVGYNLAGVAVALLLSIRI